MSDVRVIAPDGTPGVVPEADLAAAIAAGAHPVTGAEAQTALQATNPEAAELGDSTHQFAAFGLGGLKTLTMGASDAFLGSELAGNREQNLRDANAIIDHNQGAHMLGQVAGLFAGGGEAGAAAGEGLERGALSLLGREGAGLGERLLVKGVAGGLKGGMEMIPLNMGNQISEDALGDHEINAQKISAAAFNRDTALGALLGGAFGAGSEYAGTLIPRGYRAARTIDDAIAGVDGAGADLRAHAARQTRRLEELQGAGLTTAEGRAAMGDMGQLATDRALIPEMGHHVDEAAMGYARKMATSPEQQQVMERAYADGAQMLAKQEGRLDAAARKLAEEGNLAQDMSRAIDEASFAEKKANFRRLGEGVNVVAAKDASLTMLQDVDQTLSELRATATKGGKEVAVNKLTKELADAKVALRSLEDPGEMFIQVDKLKRAVQGHADFNITGPMLTEGASSFRALSERLRAGLEDEAAWGAMGTAQKELNAAHAQRLATLDPFEKSFLERYGRTDDQQFSKLVASPGKAKSFLSRVGGAEADMPEQSMRDWIAGLRGQADQAEKHLALSPAQAAKVQEGRNALTRLEKTLGETKAEAAIVAKLKSAHAEEAGHGIGGIAGLFTDAVMRPITTMDRLGALRKTVDHVTHSINNAAAKMLEGGAPAKVRSVLEGQGREQIAGLIGRIRELAANPMNIMARAEEISRDLAQYAPKHAQAIGQQLTRTVMYLAAVAPQGVVKAGLFPAMEQSKPKYTDLQLSEFQRTAQAALDPIGALDRGKLTFGQVKAIQMCSPGIYEQMRHRAMDDIARMQQKGLLDRMPYEQRQMISLMLQVPTDPTTSPELAGFIQGLKAQEPPPAPPRAQGAPSGGGQSGSKKAAPYQTEAQRLEST